MKKFLTKYFLFVLTLIVSGITVVNAAINVTSTKDKVKVTATNPTGLGFYYNNSNSFNTSTSFATNGTVKSGEGLVSLKNGTYYFWVIDTAGSKHVKGPVTINSSCTNESKTNMTSSQFTVQRCYYKDAQGKVSSDMGGSIATCANGYYLDQTKLAITTNECKNLSLDGLKKRYCKVVIQASCAKKSSTDPSGGGGNSGGGGSGGGSGATLPAAKLNYLNVSSGKLSPAFKAGTKKYTVNVDASVSSISISAGVSNGSFVNKYGPRTVNLKYGSNSVQIKVKNKAGKVTTYTINVVRSDGRSDVSTLSNITLNGDYTLSPAFSGTITKYEVKVPYETDSITIDATLTDKNSKFVSGYGPGTYSLQPGNNVINIKIQSQKGNTNVYSINVIREDIPSECTTNTEGLALLSGITLEVDNPNVQLKQIEGFSSEIMRYDVLVPNEVTSLTIKPTTVDEADLEGVVIEGNEDLQVNVPKEVSIIVKSNKCPNYSNTYILNITRQEPYEPDHNPNLQDMVIEGHDEFKYESNVDKYNLKLNKGENKLEIKKTPISGDKTTCNEVGNEELTNGSKIVITCTAEDAIETATYTINITGRAGNGSKIVIVIIIILIILLLIYLLLRLLGYKVYFNFAMIGAFFRGIGEKIKNIFDK